MVRLVFTATHKIIPRLIRAITKSDVSHGMIQFTSSLWPEDLIVEATFPKAHLTPVHIARHDVVCEFTCNFDTTDSFKVVNNLIGQWFDVRGLLIVGWIRILWMLFRRRIKVWHTSTGQQFCTELVARFVIAGKIHGTGAQLPDVEAWNPERIRPDHLKKYCLEHPNLFSRIT